MSALALGVGSIQTIAANETAAITIEKRVSGLITNSITTREHSDNDAGQR
jgi:hypothetical protein